MTQHELDKIVRLVGDELVARLGPGTANAVGAAPSSCACEPSPQTPLPSTGPPIAVSQSDLPCPEWAPPKEGIAGLIDHTLLRPDADESEITQLCAEARQYRFAAVCVHPTWVACAARELQGSGVKTCTVIGFPHGATITPVKCTETEQVLKLGACEVDMVMNAGALKSGDDDLTYTDIRCVTELAHQAGALVKVILEMGALSREQKITACVLAKLAGADFVKTSTGYGPGGAEPADVGLMHRIVGGEMGIKAAGGIGSYERMELMLQSGATRIGASAGVRIVEEAAAKGVPAGNRG